MLRPIYARYLRDTTLALKRANLAGLPRRRCSCAMPRADVVRGATEACRFEAREPAGVRLGGGGDAL